MPARQAEIDGMTRATHAGPARVWIDLANSPHVPFFAPLIPRMRRRGAEILLTARDFAQTVDLLETHELRARVIGGHSGRNRLTKGARVAGRAFALARSIRDQKVDLAASHGSYAQIIAARLCGIPSVTLMDYEFQPANHLSFRLARRVIVPAVFPEADLARCGASPSKVVRYDGFKEEVYLEGFAPDPAFDGRLRDAIEPAIEERDWLDRAILAVLRPPATFALYHGFENALFDRVVERIADVESALVLVSPRTRDQARSVLDLGRRNVRILARPVPGLDLLARADLVVSAGGTMNREAALLGTPAYTVLAAPLGAVDRRLIAEGKLRQIASLADLDSIAIRRRETRAPARVRAGLADEIAGLILATPRA